MKILFADEFPASFVDELAQLGHQCVLEPKLSADKLPNAIAGYEALVVRSTKVSDEVIQAADKLALIIRAGAGTNTIDTQAAADKGIYVCNVPGKNAVAVAELAMGLLLSIDRNIPDNVSQLRAGKWDKKRFSQAQGLYGRHIGVVGLGAIGMAMASRAAAFGMCVHVIDKPGRSAQLQSQLDALGAVRVVDLNALAQCCDVLSFHVPAAQETKALVNAQLLALVKPGTIIINTSRGDVVDEDALIAAMDEKQIRAGLDVYHHEPASPQSSFTSSIARHPNVYGTHHIGASTNQAQNAVAAGVVEIISNFNNGKVLYCVNMDV